MTLVASTVLGLVGAEVNVTIERDGRRHAFLATVAVPLAERRGCYLRPWGVRSLVHVKAEEIVFAVAAGGEGGIEAYRRAAARQKTELAALLEPAGPLDAFGHRARQYRANGYRVRGLDLLERNGASVDVIAVVNGRNERWRGVIVRAPQGRVDSVEIKPHGVGVEGVSIEICIAQIIDVSAFDPKCPMAAQIAATQRARLPGAE